MATATGDGAPRHDEDEPVDRARVRNLVVDANDGIIAVAGIGEGFLGAGASKAAAMVAVIAATVAGSIALAGAKYAGAANERDAEQALIDEEARLLALSPEEELAERAELYEDKGLSPELAARVAAELSDTNALAAQLEAEYGIDLRGERVRPWLVALSAALAFAAGATPIILAVWLSPRGLRPGVVLVAAAGSLLATSFIAGRWGKVPLGRTALRTVIVGVIALLLSLATGALFDF